MIKPYIQGKGGENLIHFYRGQRISDCIENNQVEVNLDSFWNSWAEWVPAHLQRSSRLFINAEDALDSIHIQPTGIGMVIRYSLNCQTIKKWMTVAEEVSFSSIEFFRTLNGIDKISLGTKIFNPEGK